MIKKNVIFGALLLLGIGYLYAQTLTIRVESADIGKGNLMAGIFNDEKTFPDTYFRGEKITVSDRIMTIMFNDLSKGQYAVSVTVTAMASWIKTFLEFPKKNTVLAIIRTDPILEDACLILTTTLPLP